VFGEFTTLTVPKCNEILDKQLAITTNTGVDDIDLIVLDTDSAELASTAFRNPILLGVSEVIARKEAYDFSQTHSRLNSVFSRDRSSYYSVATEELEVEKKYIKQQSAVLAKYLEFSKD